MKCSKYKRIIQRMLDGDLSLREQRAVCDHLETCAECRAYHEELAAMCAALRSADVEPPPDFRQKWKQQLASAAQPQRSRKKRFRPVVLVPIAACCAAAVFVVSTMLVNPQAFGLEGRSMSGEWYGAVVPGTPDPEPSVDQGDGQRVSFVAKSEKKPNLLDFENSDYSERTTTSSNLPELSAAGTIEPRSSEILGTIQEVLEAEGTALPEETLSLELSVSAGELERLRDRAADMNIPVLFESEEEITLEGSPSQIEELVAGHHLEVPEGADVIRLHIN